MTVVVINPGSGPIARNPKRPRSIASATANMRALLRDCGIRDATFRCTGKQTSCFTGGWDGRYMFVVTRGKRTCDVDMPGTRLDTVRRMSQEQDIWQFPRLYVDGSSWVWKYAIGQLCDALGVKRP